MASFLSRLISAKIATEKMNTDFSYCYYSDSTDKMIKQ